jgi:SAM-dependent methyltransferase
MEMASPDREDLGLGLKPGDPQYRAYVGLRQYQSLLDIGCGSLRIGRLLIPYLNRRKYFGVEPNEWLVDEGIRRELGETLVQIKCPTFFSSDSPDTISQAKIAFDFALAQSIFSHCGLDLIQAWLSAISGSLARDGALVATFLTGEEDSAQTGWIYPDCVNYRPATLERAAKDVNLRFEILDWKHPRQTWALFAAPKFESSWFKDRPLTWNTGLERALSQ